LIVLSLVCLARSRETLSLSSTSPLLGEILGKEVAWCALEELLLVTSRTLSLLCVLCRAPLSLFLLLVVLAPRKLCLSYLFFLLVTIYMRYL
jgi:hypothetical protein